MDKEKRFQKISKNIKSVKIQGARNVARAALKAYSLIPTSASVKKLISLRPTEPMMRKILDMAEKGKSLSAIRKHFDDAQNEINKQIFKLIKNGDIIFTHCHSTNVVNALIYAKHHGKKFQVYNTETRPLYQGRKTATQLKRAGIKVTMFIDSALKVALSDEGNVKKADKVFIGADALLKKGIINKIGSGLVAQIAKDSKTPFYIIADSWKYSKTNIPIEQRALAEIWKNAPKRIQIKNPAFEFVDKKYITRIISELGTLTYGEFLKKVD